MVDLIKQIAHQGEGGPRILQLTPVAAPAAGADWTITVPGQGVWQLLAVRARLVTSATVANRVVGLGLNDQTTTVFNIDQPNAVPASRTTDFNWAPSMLQTQGSGDATVTSRLPDIPLMGGWRIASATGAIQIGDQWSNVNALAIEYRTLSLGAVVELMAHKGWIFDLLGMTDDTARLP